MNDKENNNKGKLSKEDKELWQYVLRTITPIAVENSDDCDVKARDEIFSDLLLETSKNEHVEELKPSKTDRKRQTYIVKSTPNLSPSIIDRKTKKQIKQGKKLIEATLDLHGYTQDKAHDLLNRFIHRCYLENKRTVLIITGKGTRSGKEGGVLRRLLPHWLESSQVSGKILAIHEAQPKHGGSGAFYILIRRNK